MQKHVNLVDLVKSFPTNIYLQNLASIQKRTSPIKFAHLAEKSANGSISNLSTKVQSPLAPFPEHGLNSVATAVVLSEWYSNARKAKKLLSWVKQLDSSAEWLAWASTTFRFKLYGGGSLPVLFDNMYKNKGRLCMMEYAVSLRTRMNNIE